MKNLLLFSLAILICGCHHSQFDVSPDQVVKKMGGPAPKGLADMDHLPPGAVKHESTIKKGEMLPDGTIAAHDAKVVTVEMKDGPGKGIAHAMRITQTKEGPGTLETAP